MLEFYKDGKQVAIQAIYNQGHVDQVVILDNVHYGNDPDFTKEPLAQYAQPYAFTIVEKVEGKDGYYIIVDGEGTRLILRNKYAGCHGASEEHLYDANEWLTWREMQKKEQLASKEQEIAQLKSHLALLKDIFTNQGVRVVSQETAKKLGIT